MPSGNPSFGSNTTRSTGGATNVGTSRPAGSSSVGSSGMGGFQSGPVGAPRAGSATSAGGMFGGNRVGSSSFSGGSSNSTGPANYGGSSGSGGNTSGMRSNNAATGPGHYGGGGEMFGGNRSGSQSFGSGTGPGGMFSGNRVGSQSSSGTGPRGPIGGDGRPRTNYVGSGGNARVLDTMRGPLGPQGQKRTNSSSLDRLGIRNTTFASPRDQAMQHMIGRGWTPSQSAGIIGNLAQESGFNPNAFNAPEHSFGLAQWRGDRLKSLETFAGTKKPTAVAQLDFIDRELRGTAPIYSDPFAAKAGQRFMDDPEMSAAQASKSFSGLYERPATKYANNANRAKQANKALAGLGAGGVPTSAMVASLGPIATSSRAPTPGPSFRPPSDFPSAAPPAPPIPQRNPLRVGVPVPTQAPVAGRIAAQGIPTPTMAPRPQAPYQGAAMAAHAFAPSQGTYFAPGVGSSVVSTPSPRPSPPAQSTSGLHPDRQQELASRRLSPQPLVNTASATAVEGNRPMDDAAFAAQLAAAQRKTASMRGYRHQMAERDFQPVPSGLVSTLSAPQMPSRPMVGSQPLPQLSTRSRKQDQEQVPQQTTGIGRAIDVADLSGIMGTNLPDPPGLQNMPEMEGLPPADFSTSTQYKTPATPPVSTPAPQIQDIKPHPDFYRQPFFQPGPLMQPRPSPEAMPGQTIGGSQIADVQQGIEQGIDAGVGAINKNRKGIGFLAGINRASRQASRTNASNDHGQERRQISRLARALRQRGEAASQREARQLAEQIIDYSRITYT
jgi:hypothetical protein